MTKYMTLDDMKVKNKLVLVRVDFNSAIDPETKMILDDTRIRVHGETTIKELSQKGAKVVVLAHQGRKGESDFTPLKKHVAVLSAILGKPIKYVDDLFGEKAQKAIRTLDSGEILVLENVRMNDRETKKGSPEEHAQNEFIQKIAPLADLFVNDAFATAHRAHVSIVGFTAVIPSAAGRIMERELTSLDKVAENPAKPCIYILGGAKADDSLEISKYVLDNEIADYILTGGIIGHTFLLAKDLNLGKPNMELLQEKGQTRLVPGIKELIKKYPEKIKVPLDVALKVREKRREVVIEELPLDYPILDIGKKTVETYTEIIRKSNSIVLSGPMGVFENINFNYGTQKIYEGVANSNAYSVAGGGHTIAALKKFGFEKRISYISTAGGALIEFLMGKQLPGVAALERKN